MNFYYDPVNAAKLAAWNYYFCPVQGAQEEIGAVRQVGRQQRASSSSTTRRWQTGYQFKSMSLSDEQDQTATSASSTR